MAPESAGTEVEGCQVVAFADAPIVNNIYRSPYKGLSASLDFSGADNLTSIGDGAFYGCTQLTSLDHLEGATSLTAIGDSAFRDCTSLASTLTLPASLTTLGGSAFQNCSSLTSLDFSDANKLTAIVDSTFRDCTQLTSLDHLEGATSLTSIGDNAFYTCSNLASVNLSGATSLTSLGGNAFRDCASLAGSLTLPSSLTSIGSYAFSGCSFDSATMPSGLQFLGDQAFADNHLWGLGDLPPSCRVGRQPLANQKVTGPLPWMEDPQDASSALVVLDGGLGEHGVALSSVGWVQLLSATDGTWQMAPYNADWKDKGWASFPKSYVQASGASIRYGFQSLATPSGGGAAAMTKLGDVTVAGLSQTAAPTCTLLWYDGFGPGAALKDSLTVSLRPGDAPAEAAGGGNFGLGAKVGYHAPSGAYDALTDAGWREVPAGAGDDWAPAVRPGTPVDPALQPAQRGDARRFYNRWLPDAYSVNFDNNFGYMSVVDPGLDARDDSNNLKYVSGSMEKMSGLTYTTPADLPSNAFTMGGYTLVGWATTPDLAVTSRVEGSNFFKPDSQISTPDTVLADGGEITLYAQWEATDLSSPDHIADNIFIPARISLSQSGGPTCGASPTTDLKMTPRQSGSVPHQKTPTCPASPGQLPPPTTCLSRTPTPRQAAC